jgi:ABC-2 type transport system ATP-binding protein
VRPPSAHEIAAAHCFTGLREQPREQAELGRRQRNGALWIADRVRHRIKPEPRAVDGGVVPAPPQQRLEARHELDECERLAEIVVAAGIEAGNSIHQAVASGEEQHGCMDALRPEGLAQVAAVAVREADVDHERIRHPTLEAFKHLAAGRNRVGGETLLPQPACEDAAQLVVVLDDHDSLAERHRTRNCHFSGTVAAGRSGNGQDCLQSHRYRDLVIEVRDLTKDYGSKRAVDGLSFTVEPGVVTGFLGPNGSGKSTTMRLILGLDAPTRGDARVNGKHYRDLTAPLHEVGALLESRSVHTGRSAYNHLLALAQTQGISRRRVNELIDLVGLREVANKRAGQFSLGMGQRLGIATALLGDPQTVMLDEPVNGLDPEGIHWIRNLLKRLAAEGRTVFVSSHLMGEMSMTADHLIVIGRGKLIADTSVDEFVAQASANIVVVRSPELPRLRRLLEGPDVTFEEAAREALEVRGLSAAQIGDAAAANGIAIHELTPRQASLEEAFMSLTSSEVEFASLFDTDQPPVDQEAA